MEAYGRLNNHMEPLEVIRNSKRVFSRPKQFNSDRRDRQTDPCIELRYAQLIMYVELCYKEYLVQLLFSKGHKLSVLAFAKTMLVVLGGGVLLES